jgi:hypothetical protein
MEEKMSAQIGIAADAEGKAQYQHYRDAYRFALQTIRGLMAGGGE